MTPPKAAVVQPAVDPLYEKKTPTGIPAYCFKK